ncbi:ABC transporter substrate-binding protein [Helicobacter cetorum]|uniref:ABC transporter substrate-binding protein n=1 Tax=Helicobacter cetorum TaxID=138563 RepID=UPI000CF0DAB4|nr:ABC transporter substrate-binding protein [Helicobacter cetorum]
MYGAFLKVLNLFFFLFFGAFWGFLSATSSLSQSNEQNDTPPLYKERYGGTLIYARASDSQALDPALVVDAESFSVIGNVYETLVRFKYGTTELEPSLAKSWEISKDALVYTFHLRKGVYFHTTKYWNKKVELKAKDVVFSFERQMKNAKTYYKNKSYKYWQGMGMDNLIASVKALDDYTIQITLKHKESPFLADLGMDFLGIVSKDYADYLAKNQRQDELAKKPIGTGPFKLAMWMKDEKIVLLRNEDYWDRKAYLDRVVFRVVPNASIRALALRTSEVSMISAPNPNEVASLAQLPHVVVDKATALFVTWLSLNLKKPPFDKALVRQAINHAIDANAYIKVVYEGYAKQAINPIPLGMWSYNESIQPYEFDIQKAKDLLKKAGFEKGFSTTLYTASKYNKKGAEFIQASLAKIGIKVKIEFLEWGAYLKKVSMGEYFMSFSGWMADTPDPDNFLYLLWSKQSALELPTQNVAFYESEEFSKLVTKAKEVIDKQERTKLYQKAQEVFHKDAPWVGLAYPYTIVPHLKNVKGYKPTGVSVHRFYEVYLENKKGL